MTPKKRKPLAPDHPQKRTPAKIRAAKKAKDFPRPMGIPCASDGVTPLTRAEFRDAMAAAVRADVLTGHDYEPFDAPGYQYPTPWRMRVSVALHWLAARLANLSGWLDRTAARIRWG